MNDEQNSVASFLGSGLEPFGLVDFTINLFMVALFATLLAKCYVKFSYTVSNREVFSKNFVLIATTTMIIIAIVKTSLTLSLGLIGALALVRFRTPIKEPEELTFLFLSIAIGVGFGANQRLLTSVGIIFILTLIVLRNLHRSSTHAEPYDTRLSISITNPPADCLQTITSLLSNSAHQVALQRLDESENLLECDFIVEFDGFSTLNSTRESLRNTIPHINVSILDNKNIQL